MALVATSSSAPIPNPSPKLSVIIHSIFDKIPEILKANGIPDTDFICDKNSGFKIRMPAHAEDTEKSHWVDLNINVEGGIVPKEEQAYYKLFLESKKPRLLQVFKNNAPMIELFRDQFMMLVHDAQGNAFPQFITLVSDPVEREAAFNNMCAKAAQFIVKGQGVQSLNV